MLGTSSGQILMTFYQERMCQRFSLTPLQGVAKLLRVQHAYRLRFLSQPMSSILFSFLILLLMPLVEEWEGKLNKQLCGT